MAPLNHGFVVYTPWWKFTKSCWCSNVPFSSTGPLRFASAPNSVIMIAFCG